MKIYVNSLTNLPPGEHWVILKESSHSSPAVGEWAPGHGYPASTEHYLEYIAFDNEAEFKSELEREFRSVYSRVRGIHVTEQFVPVTRVEIKANKAVREKREER